MTDTQLSNRVDFLELIQISLSLTLYFRRRPLPRTNSIHFRSDIFGSSLQKHN